MHEASAAALLVHKIQAPRDRVVEPFPSCHPCPGDDLARQYSALGCRQGIRRVTPFVFEQVAQIFVTREPEQPAAAAKVRGKLKVGEIGASA